MIASEQEPDWTDPPAPLSVGGRVEAVARASRILKSFDMVHPVMSVRQIAERTGISRSSCHAIITSLVAEGLMETRPGGGYQLGQGLAPLGGMVLERTGLVERATPLMESLSWRLGGEVHLAYSSGRELIYLVRVRRDRQVHMPNRYGEPTPLTRTGAGWAVLLTLSDAQLRERLSALDEWEERHIAEQISGSRPRGYVVHENYELGTTSIAAPIRMGNGVVAALSVAQLRPLLKPQHAIETSALVLHAASQLEQYYRRRASEEFR